VEYGGQRRYRDLLIHVDGRASDRDTERSMPYRSEYFHVPLSELELGDLAVEKPDVVIVGAGFKGMMSLTPRARELLSDYESVVVTTDKAIERVNSERRRFYAILHLTC
jgi:hypothetical protein